jgi:O-antigen/teichoic acid export membrane protein
MSNRPRRPRRENLYIGRDPAPPTRAEAWYFTDQDAAQRRTAAVAKIAQTGELDAGLYERQMAGINALVSLANDVAVVARTGEFVALPAAGRRPQDRLTALAKRLRQDPMALNSLYLVLNSGLQAVFGFGFWIVTAHLFSVPDVGKASALISATTLIGNFALFGLNNTMGRYLPTAANPSRLISSGLALVAVCGGLGALIYIFLTPLIAPDLSFVEKNLSLLVGFAVITAFSSVNTLTDSVFVASRRAKYTAFVDGVVGGLGKVALAVAFTSAGAYGLFLASGLSIVLSSAASLLLIFTAMRIRLDLKKPRETLEPLFKFSGANYIGNIFNTLPGLAVPVILLDRLGATSAAYFFVVFQVAQMVYAAALALEQTFLAEGSRSDADVRGLKRRSRRILIMLCLPTALGIIAIGRWLLLAFGTAYYHNGFASLVIMALAAGPIAANYWLLTVLRLAGKLRAIVVVNGVYAVTTCIFVWIGTSHGLTAVAIGWFGGAFIAACVGAVAARERPGRSPKSEPKLQVSNSAQGGHENAGKL